MFIDMLLINVVKVIIEIFKLNQIIRYHFKTQLNVL